jgi:hypothetical protein
MSVLETLIKARALIEKPEMWAGSDSALGLGTNCATTAIGQSYAAHTAFAVANSLPTVQQGAFGAVIDFNDTHSHAEVIAAFDRAIEAERAKEAS